MLVEKNRMKMLINIFLFCTRLALRGGAPLWILKALFLSIHSSGLVHNILFCLCLSPLSDPVATVRDLRLDTLLQWNFGHTLLRCTWMSVANSRGPWTQVSGSMFMKYEKAHYLAVCLYISSMTMRRNHGNLPSCLHSRKHHLIYLHSVCGETVGKSQPP